MPHDLNFTRAIAATLAAICICSSAVQAQTFVRVGAGMTMSSKLVDDFIAEPLSVRPALAPTLMLLVGHQMSGGYRLGMEVRAAKSSLELSDDSQTDDLGGLTTLGLSLWADGELRSALRWEVAAGLLSYRPENELGIFSEGGPARLMLGGGIAWHRPIGSALSAVVSLRYDFHPFNTDRLTLDGYAGSQPVHRVGLGVSLERGF